MSMVMYDNNIYIDELFAEFPVRTKAVPSARECEAKFAEIKKSRYRVLYAKWLYC